ncbi:CTP-dependent riboflavin kinase [Halorarius halobius]|uniref:CTP-dependent riboflavin kinase n=1 Tax=Halorarius halobius TaxID=2962671 RepID=UPI0020CFD247|nr:CTP-dependent riboflavin kinase [Halorarius halobius]
MFVTDTDTPASIKYDELATLKHLAKKGAVRADAKLSCSLLAEELEISAQTASRRLRSLEKSEYIRRHREKNTMRVTITPRGIELLEAEFQQYLEIFDSIRTVELEGEVCSGAGEGEYYIQLDGYMEQFEEKLGYQPFPGTFNVRIDESDVPSRAVLETFDAVQIEEWESDGRTYGAASCYPATVTAAGDTIAEAHILDPDRTHHGDEYIELIATERLREALAVEDGDGVTITVGRLPGAEE